MMGVTWVLRPSPLLYFPPSFKNETKKKIHKLTHKPIFKIYVSLIIYRGSYVQIIKKYLSILRQCIAWFEENIFYFYGTLLDIGNKEIIVFFLFFVFNC